ncbi:hypothetical protein MJO28_008552, partial [Puccinia striiformis f. sp. tritici]
MPLGEEVMDHGRHIPADVEPEALSIKNLFETGCLSRCETRRTHPGQTKVFKAHIIRLLSSTTMHWTRQKTTLLALSCLQATHLIMGQTKPPLRLLPEANPDELEAMPTHESAMSSQAHPGAGTSDQIDVQRDGTGQQITKNKNKEKKQPSGTAADFITKTEVKEEHHLTLEEEFNTLREQLLIFQGKVVEQNSHTTFWGEATNALDVRKLLSTKIDIPKDFELQIKELQNIHKLIPNSNRDRLFKLTDNEVVIEPLAEPIVPPVPLEPVVPSSLFESLMQRGRSLFTWPKDTSSEADTVGSRTPVEAQTIVQDSEVSDPKATETFVKTTSPEYVLESGVLTGDTLGIVRRMASWDWLEKLNTLLHKILPIEDVVKLMEFKTGNFEALLLQHFVFRTVELLFKHSLIPQEHVVRLLESRDTVRLAAAAVSDFRFRPRLSDLNFGDCFQGFVFSKEFNILVIEGIKKIDPIPSMPELVYFYHRFQPNSRGKSSAIGGTENTNIHRVELGDNDDQLRRRPTPSEDSDIKLACPQGERTRRQVSAAVNGEAGAIWISDTRPLLGEGTSQQNGAGTNPEAHATQLPEAGLAQTEERRQKIDGGLESNGKTGTMGKLLLTRKDGFDALRGQLVIFKQVAIRKNSMRNIYREVDDWWEFCTRFKEKKKLLRDIQKLQSIHRLLPASERDRLFKLSDQEVVLAPLKPAEPLEALDPKSMLKKDKQRLEEIHTRKKTPSSSFNLVMARKPVGDLKTSRVPRDSHHGAEESSTTISFHLEPGKLTGDVLDNVRKSVTSDWLEKLNVLLHKIIPAKRGVRIIATNTGNLEALLLQHFVFRTVELIHKNGLVSSEQVLKFLEVPDTMLVAAAMVYEWTFLLPLGRNGYRGCFTSFNFSEDFTNIIKQDLDEDFEELEQRAPTMEEELDSLQQQVAMFKKTTAQKNSILIALLEGKGWKVSYDQYREGNKLTKVAGELQLILNTLPTSKEDRLFKLIDKGIELSPLEPKKSVRNQLWRGILKRITTLKSWYETQHLGSETTASDHRSAKALSTSNSPTNPEAGKLRGNELDLVMDWVTWGWLDKLAELLHETISIEAANEIIRTGDRKPEALLLHQFIFRTVEYLHKHELIPLSHLSAFLATKDTVQFAGINVFRSWKFILNLSHWYWNFTGF